jgi:hypothetical protein
MKAIKATVVRDDRAIEKIREQTRDLLKHARRAFEKADTDEAPAMVRVVDRCAQTLSTEKT